MIERALETNQGVEMRDWTEWTNLCNLMASVSASVAPIPASIAHFFDFEVVGLTQLWGGNKLLNKS